MKLSELVVATNFLLQTDIVQNSPIMYRNYERGKYTKSEKINF